MAFGTDHHDRGSPPVSGPKSNPKSGPKSGPKPNLEALKSYAKRTGYRDIQAGLHTNTPDKAAILPLGVQAIDRHLPMGGMGFHGLHDIVWQSGGSATAFTAWLAGAFARRKQSLNRQAMPVLWIQRQHHPDDGYNYAPGLAAYGLDMGLTCFLACKHEQDAFWCCEEALKSRHFAAIICEGQKEAARPGPVALRRLHLAAERSATPVLLLRPAHHDAINAASDTASDTGDPWAVWRRTPSPALTRWSVTPHALSDNAMNSQTAWTLTLLRCRGADTACWNVRLDHETLSLDLVTPSVGRASVAPSAA